MSERRDAVADLSDIAHAVRERRQELRLRFEDVGNMAGVSRHLVASIEKGEPNEQFDKLLRVLAALQIKVDLRRGPPRHVDLPVAAPKPARTRINPAVDMADMHKEPGRVRCLDCGAGVRDIGRHVRQQHGLSIAGYRQRWNIDEEVSLRPTEEVQ